MKKIINNNVIITYNKKGNIKKCVSIFENDATFKPLESSGVSVHSSYVPLIQSDINTWFKNNC